MALKLKHYNAPSPAAHFSWDNLPTSPSVSPSPPEPQSPPTLWLSAKDMKTFGSEPLRCEIGVVKCKECDKPILRSAVVEHQENCRKIRAGALKKGTKATVDSKKRKAEDEGLHEEGIKKKKVTPKVTKGRSKGPVDYDKQCGVINDKGLPCSRSLTCKSHSMGAKRAVSLRSRPYDELLLEWNRAHNPNWVEPVKRETKAEKKEKREKEKAVKKQEAAAAALLAGKNVTGGVKKGKKAAAAAAVADAVAKEDAADENIDDLDSEAEIDSLVKAVKIARASKVIAVPLAVPCDAGTWFVARRERLRNCSELLSTAFSIKKGIQMPLNTIAGPAG